MYEWISTESLENHYRKHVQGFNNDNKDEPALWEQISIKSKEEYKEISIKNIYDGSGYLYKIYRFFLD